MTTQRFALDPKGPKRLVISWTGQFKNFIIKLDERAVDSISGQAELKLGRKFELPDGSVLKVQLVGLLVRLSRDGKPVPGSPDDPAQKIKNAYNIIFVIAGSNIIGNLLTPLSVNFFVFGLGFLGLGFLVKRRSLPALMIAIGLYVYFAIQFFVLSYQNLTYGWTTVGCFLPVYFLIFAYLYQGVKAIRALRS